MVLQVAGCAKKNRAPTIEEFDGSPPFGEAPLDVRLWWTISDPDGDALSCKLDLDGDGKTDHTISDCTSEEVYNFVIEEPGRHHVTLTVSDGKDSVSRTVELYSNQCIFRPETVWPEQDPTFGGATVHDGGQVDLLFHSAVSAPIIENGTILWGTSAGGYLRRVTGVYFVTSPHGKRYELQTEDVKLEEAVETCKFGIRDYQMRFAGAECKEDCDEIDSILPFVDDGPGVKGGVSIGHTVNFSKINLGDGVSIKPSAGLKITINRAYLDVEFLSLKEFTFEATPEVSFSAKLEVKIASATWDQEWPLCGPIYLAAVPIGPLVFTPVINLTAAVHVGLEPTLTYGLSASFGVTGGISYVKDEGTTIWGSATKAADILEPSIKLGIGSAQVGLKKRTSFLLFGLIGPYVGGHVYVKGDLSADLLQGEVCLSGKVGADAIYGANINLFLHQIFIEDSNTVATVGFYNQCWFGSECGDGTCQAGEDCASCPADCECPPACGDGVVDSGETCDPPSTCPQDAYDCDDSDSCTEDSVTGAPSSCDAECVHTAITACVDGDGCCPAACDTTSDNDCSAACGNGVLDPGETCDPPSTCPTSCGDGDPCTTDTMTGSAANCNAYCLNDLIFSCSGGDGCCPVGCDSGNDSDCSATCGNGIVDAGETCDPPSSCPTSCYDADDCTSDALIGSASTCTAQCPYNAITSCGGGDGCCPSGCNQANDIDCNASCGNNICEPSEACGTSGECASDCNCNISTDPCDGYAGHYCGATGQFSGGTAGYLYYCSSDVTQSSQYCSYGCVVAPPGSPDYCAPPPSCLEYGDACGVSDCCDQGACVSGYCCLGSGTGAPGDVCGSGNDCCSGHCHLSGLCCWNPDPPGCIL